MIIKTRRYLNGEFRYTEVDVSGEFWQPVLNGLFPDNDLFMVCAQYSLREIDILYPLLKVDFCVLARSGTSRQLSRCPLLFVELSKEPLTDPYFTHKDDVKIGFSMGSALLKIMSFTWGRGVGFLRDLRIYGILGGATDFEICCLFPVFPNDDSLEDFYFVLSCSKNHLRFHVLENNLEKSLFCAGTEEGLVRSELIHSSDPRNAVQIAMSSTKRSEFGCMESQYMFQYGKINSNSLKVLEKLGSLVERQAELIGEFNPDEFHYPEFKYDSSRIALMEPGRSARTATKKLLKRYRSATYEGYSPSRSPSTRSLAQARNLLIDIGTFDKENIEDNLVGDENISQTPGEKVVIPNPVEYFFIEKGLGDYEIEIYRNPIIKDSPLFPDLIDWRLILENGTIEFKIEKLESNIMNVFEVNYDYGLCQMIVDILGAIRTLHKAGYVHGDITPWNLGYSYLKKLFNLFDFDSSRTIADGLRGKCGFRGSYKGTDGFISDFNGDTNIYAEIDDYVGFAKSVQFLLDDDEFEFSNNISKKVLSLMSPLLLNTNTIEEEEEFIDILYCDSVKLLWEINGGQRNEPSIKCAVQLLGEIQKNK